MATAIGEQFINKLDKSYCNHIKQQYNQPNTNIYDTLALIKKLDLPEADKKRITENFQGGVFLNSDVIIFKNACFEFRKKSYIGSMKLQ